MSLIHDLVYRARQYLEAADELAKKKSESDIDLCITVTIQPYDIERNEPQHGSFVFSYRFNGISSKKEDLTTDACLQPEDAKAFTSQGNTRFVAVVKIGPNIGTDPCTTWAFTSRSVDLSHLFPCATLTHLQDRVQVVLSFDAKKVITAVTVKYDPSTIGGVLQKIKRLAFLQYRHDMQNLLMKIKAQKEP